MISSVSSSAQLQLNFLGGFEVRRLGQAVAGFTYNKMRALLAYLAVEREQDHSRDFLADLFWESCDSVDARGNLRRTLSNLRRALERPGDPPLFSVGKSTIRLLPEFWLDVHDFQTRASKVLTSGTPDGALLESVAARYQGEFLSGLSVSDSPGFGEWMDLQRGTLKRQALALQDAACNAYQQVGDDQKALLCALRYAELDPLNEVICRRVMRLLASNGQHSAASLHYQNFCRLIESDLGEAPAPETQKLSVYISAEEVQVQQGRRNKPRSELRQVSVLYCEFQPIGITDPEDAKSRIAQPRNQCLAVVEGLHGHVVRTLDSGLLAYFGYPIGNEDAVRNAVQAGLLIMQEPVPGVIRRVGVHTELVISKGGLPDEVGALTRTALSLVHSASINQFLVTQQTQRLVAGYFECECLSNRLIPDNAVPWTLFRVLRETGARGRLDAAGLAGLKLTPLHGRASEIGRLIAFWQSCAPGARQSVLIQGEPGMGKSRLLQVFKEQLQGVPHFVCELRCLARFSQTAFYPMLTLLEALIGLDNAQAPPQNFDRLARFFERHHRALAASAIPLLARLLSLPMAAPYAARQGGAETPEQQTLAVLLALLQALAQQRALLLIVEDAHLADPFTARLLSVFYTQRQDSLLMLMSARPGFVLPWDLPAEHTLTLGPLTEQQVRAMIADLSPQLDRATVAQIVARADGVPLYVEELVKLAAIGKVANVPFSLCDLLAQRLDQLGEVKHTVQLASVFGAEFTLEMLQTMFAQHSGHFGRDLRILLDQGLLTHHSEGRFRFTQALVRDAAYQSLPRMDRQAAHRTIATSLLTDFSGQAMARAECVAPHLSAAGLARASIDQWVEAGVQALRSADYPQSFDFFMGGVQLLAVLPADSERAQLAATLCRGVCQALIALKGFGPSEFGRAYRMAQRFVRISTNRLPALASP